MDFVEYNACSSSEAMDTAEIVNETQQALDVRLSNSVYVVRLARLRRGATYTVLANRTDTYQEYKFSPRGCSADTSTSTSSTSLVVTSDDCCDYKRIVITEVDGQFAVQREPRVYSEGVMLQETSAASPPPREVEEEGPQRECGSDVGVSSWKCWIRLRIF